MGPTDDEVIEWFYPKQVYDTAFNNLRNIRDAFADAARVVLDHVPPSADRTTALRELAASSRIAVFAFTHHQEQ